MLFTSGKVIVRPKVDENIRVTEKRESSRFFREDIE